MIENNYHYLAVMYVILHPISSPPLQTVRTSHNGSVILIQDNPSKISLTTYFASAQHPFSYYQWCHPPVVLLICYAASTSSYDKGSILYYFIVLL